MPAPTSVELETLLYRREGFRAGRPCVAGTTTTVHTIAAEYLRGLSPEAIVQEFPRLDLPRVYAALAYFLSNREQVMADLEQDLREAERLSQEFKSPRQPA